MDYIMRCAELEKRIADLEAENRELRRKLGISNPKPAKAVPATAVHNRSTPAEKIRLFRSLFHGREDVFAQRWYSTRTEKAGYTPVCANEWKPGVCIKPNGTCSKCEHRELVPLSDRVIYGHLSGKDAYGRDVVGLYPILPNDTCCFLAIDFDDGAWQENVNAVRNVCNEWEIPCAVERSRSGEGAHLWIFFSDPLPCSTARKLGSALLTAAMEREGTLKLDAYDRMFPCQDTLPSGGFGNLIALPLQGLARKKGNSVFVDEVFVPYPDQWAYLCEIKKMNADDVERIIKQHTHGDALGTLCSAEPAEKPWEKKQKPQLSPLDFIGVQKITRANMLFIPLSGLSARGRNHLLRLAAFRNPEFYKAQAMRLPIYDKPRIICAAEEQDSYLALPRCCEDSLIDLLEQSGAVYEIDDQTCPGKPIRVSCKGTLRDEQQPAADALLAHSNGVLSATTAFGKTVVAAYLIAQRKVNTLILVHTQALLNLSSRSHFLGDLVLFTNETLRAAFFVDVQPKGPMGTYPDAINKQVAFFESYLMEQKYVSKNLSGFTLLPKGLARVDELQRHQSENSKNAFIAMSFSDEMEPVRNAIKDALIECGFVPRIMDEIEHNHQIVPEMLHEIREARFLVAELSSGNNGAYFEAGYAAGFGKDVILLFNENVSDNDRHFDVRQTNTIKWRDPNDLKERLVARIKATMI